MRSTDIRLAVALLAVAAMASPLLGQDGEDHPTVWMGPPSYDNARCFRELFENPDAWKETRSVIDVLQCADHQLDRQFTDDSTWYVSIMQQGYDYAMVQGRPDQYVIESWIESPSKSTPDSEPWTFTRSVLDFVEKLVKR